ncbi:MAG TPA: hypothetical protein VGJ58_00460 [Gaiellaceae bacterium]|jgi:hypothetical protein
MTGRRIRDIETDARRLRLERALRRIDEAIEQLDLGADATALERLREDLRAALRLNQAAAEPTQG